MTETEFFFWLFAAGYLWYGFQEWKRWWALRKEMAGLADEVETFLAERRG